MQCRLVARKVTKMVTLTSILEWLGVALGSLWSPNGTPEALVLEVEILIAKKVTTRLAALGGTWRHLRELWVPGPQRTTLKDPRARPQS